MMYYHMEIFKKVDVIVTPTTGYASSLLLASTAVCVFAICCVSIAEMSKANANPSHLLRFLDCTMFWNVFLAVGLSGAGHLSRYQAIIL